MNIKTNFFRILKHNREKSSSIDQALQLWSELKRSEDGEGFVIHFLDRVVSFTVKVEKK